MFDECICIEERREPKKVIERIPFAAPDETTIKRIECMTCGEEIKDLS
jgi:hypothetical protein